MTAEPRMRELRRPRRAAVLVAIAVAVLLSAAPGTATAAAPQVVPLINCYYPHSDGSVTVVLGYRSTWPQAHKIAQGRRNYTTPSSYAGSLPTRFEPGTHNGVATVRIPARDLTTTTAWYLDGTTLNYLAATSAVATCTQAELPAFANGAAIAAFLLLAGIAGALVVRRGRRTARTASRIGTPRAAGGDRA